MAVHFVILYFRTYDNNFNLYIYFVFNNNIKTRFDLKISRIHLTLFVGFGLHLSIAIWNGFFGPSFGADLDALSFHTIAVEYAEIPTLEIFRIGWIYSYFLGIFYSITIGHIFLGSLLSCIAWTLSALVLLKILDLLAVNNRNKYLALLIYTILPSSLLYTSVTLREVYQLLFINIAIYSSLMILIRRSLAHWVLFFLGIIGAGILHGALLVFGILLTTLTLLFSSTSVRSKGVVFWGKLTITIPLIVIVLVFGMSISSENSYQLDANIISSVKNFQNSAIAVGGRTNYKSDVSLSSVFDFLTFVPVSIFQYLFEPMPWKISSVVDIPVFFENILRFWLILIAVRGWRTSSPRYSRPLLLILISYFVLETIWSLGTVNWGTASRHHIPSFGILVVAAFANRKIKRRQALVKR